MTNHIENELDTFSRRPNVTAAEADIIARNLAGVESHFHAEDNGSVSQALEAFTDDGVWEAPNPGGLNKRLEGKAAIRPFYEKLFTTMKDVTFRICYERFATADRVVDDSIYTFEVAADGIWPYPVGTQVFMRIVHVFDMRRTKCCRSSALKRSATRWGRRRSILAGGEGLWKRQPRWQQ